MPVSFLTEEQQRRYGRFNGEPSAEHLARSLHFDDADATSSAPGAATTCASASPFSSAPVRFLGTFLDDLTEAPPRVNAFVGKQIGITPGGRTRRPSRRASGRWRHEVEIGSDTAIGRSPSRGCKSVSTVGSTLSAVQGPTGRACPRTCRRLAARQQGRVAGTLRSRARRRSRSLARQRAVVAASDRAG